MKRTNLLKSMLLLCALVVGSESVWADDADISVKYVDFTQKLSGKSDYSSEWTYDSWKVKGNNNNKGWAFIRCGGKSSKNGTTVTGTATLKSPQVTSAVTKVIVSHLGINSTKQAGIDGFSVTSIVLQAYSDESLSIEISSTTLSGGSLPNLAKTDPISTKTFTITPAATIPANSYYKLSINWSMTNTNNAGLDIAKVVLYNTVDAVSVTLPAAGENYGTLVSEAALDFSNATPSGLTAYVASSLSASSVTLTSVEELPSGSPVVLHGTAGTTYSIPVKTSATFSGTNNLKGALTTPTEVDANSVYVLNSGVFKLSTGAGFVPAGKAYLLATDLSSAHELFLNFGDASETTSLNEVENKRIESNVEFYDLQGRKIGKPTKGFYIVNGKKVVIK